MPDQCPALAWTNNPARLIVQCRFDVGHAGSHLESPNHPQHQEEQIMNTTDNRPVNEKALRRWINEGYEGAASCTDWTLEECLAFAQEHHVRGLDAFRTTDWREFPMYRDAKPQAQATVDAVFNAVRNVAGPNYGMDVNAADGSLGCSFTWHDGAQYRVQITGAGALARLFRMELTGGWGWDEQEERNVPETTWRTVRTFSKDRAGKVLASLTPTNPANPAWTEASSR